MSESDHLSSPFAYHMGRLLGKYQLLSLIDRGGMAEVYKSYHPDLERDLAVKILYPHFTDLPGFIERFRREAKAAAALRHPNIVQIFDFDQSEDGLYYMVLEYIDGQSLESFLKSQAPLTLPQTLALFRQIASATQYAHDHGLIHRDIKPANILLDKQGQVYLADFGIAQIVGMSRLTQTDTTAGTPIYMAPEQADSHLVTAEADVYSLGMLLYKMLTDHLPYESENVAMLMVQKVTRPPLSPRQFKPDLPVEVEQVLLKALAQKPEDRFLDVISMTWALEEAYNSVPEGDLADTAVRKRRSVASELPLNRLDHYEIRTLLPHSETLLTRRYVAHNEMLDKLVLVELLKSANEGDEVLFEQRMMAFSQLEHPHIAPVTFINQSADGYWYAAFDYKPGMALSIYLQGGLYSVPTCLRLMRQVAAALQAIHSVNLVHGELQAEIVYVGDDEQIWLLGLGAVAGEPSVRDNIQAFGRLWQGMHRHWPEAVAAIIARCLVADGLGYGSMTAVITALDEILDKAEVNSQSIFRRLWVWPVLGGLIVVSILALRGGGRLWSPGEATLLTAATAEVVIVADTAVNPTSTLSPTSTVTELQPTTASESLMTHSIQIISITYNPDGEDAAGEYIMIENSGAEPVVLTGWQLQDSAQRTHVFTFPAFTLAAAAQVKIWTGRGLDDTDDLYWGFGTAIWNNDGDTASLYDGSGQLMAECRYEGGEVTAVCP